MIKLFKIKNRCPCKKTYMNVSCVCLYDIMATTPKIKIILMKHDSRKLLI